MSRLTFLSKLILFLTSYVPLGIICLIIDFDKLKYPFFVHSTYSLVLLVLIILLPISLFSMIRHFKKRAVGWEGMKIVSVQNMDSELLSYIFTYILPFLGFPEERRIIVILFLLLIIGILYVRSDMIGINPILALLGYHIVRVEWKKDDWASTKEATVLSKMDYFSIKHTDIINAIQIQNELHLLREV